MAYRGRYKVVNKAKYAGDHTKVTYRSGLERTLMRYLDLHSDVITWSSEEVIVPYRSPVDNRIHRYFVDMFARIKQADGSFVDLLIEVKPRSQCQPPVKKLKKTRRYISEAMTWSVNAAKWAAAKQYAEARGWRFVVMTEKEIQGIS